MQRLTDILPTRQSLLEKARGNEAGKVWEELLDYYEPFIGKILLRMGFRGSDLDDARQQVALKLWKGLRNYRKGEARFRNWLSTLIRNAAIDWLRSQRGNRQTVGLDSSDADLPDPERPEIEILIEEEWQRYIVKMAMENLKAVFSGRALEVFLLSLHGRSVEAIAQELDLRKESVYVLRTRVKTRLRHEIRRLRSELEGPAHE